MPLEHWDVELLSRVSYIFALDRLSVQLLELLKLDLGWQ